MDTIFSDKLIETCGVLIGILFVIYLMFNFLKFFLNKQMLKKRENEKNKSNKNDNKKENCPMIRIDCSEKFDHINNELTTIKIRQGENGVSINYLVKGQDEIKDDIKCIKNKILGA